MRFHPKNRKKIICTHRRNVLRKRRDFIATSLSELSFIFIPPARFYKRVCGSLSGCSHTLFKHPIRILDNRIYGFHCLEVNFSKLILYHSIASLKIKKNSYIISYITSKWQGKNLSPNHSVQFSSSSFPFPASLRLLLSLAIAYFICHPFSPSSHRRPRRASVSSCRHISFGCPCA